MVNDTNPMVDGELSTNRCWTSLALVGSAGWQRWLAVLAGARMHAFARMHGCGQSMR